MDVFCKQRPAEKLLPGSARAQELTSAVVDFVIRDLRPVSVVDNVGFLHLMEVAEPRYSVPCRRTINSYIDKWYFNVKACVQQELKQVEFMGMTTDMWISRAKDGYISLTAHCITGIVKSIRFTGLLCIFLISYPGLPRTDFMSQPWRKSGSKAGYILSHS